MATLTFDAGDGNVQTFDVVLPVAPVVTPTEVDLTSGESITIKAA